MSTARDIVVAYFEALGGDDADLIADLVADDFVNEHLSALGEGSVGRATYRTRLDSFLADFPRRSYAIEEIIEAPSADGVQVVARYTLAAVHDGDDVAVPGIMWCVVRDGRIAKRTDLWDSLTFLRQTGQDGAHDRA